MRRLVKRFMVTSVAVTLATMTACSDTPHPGRQDAMSISGGCTVRGRQQSPENIVSTQAVSALLGKGAYAMRGSLSVDGKGRATDGSCDITPSGRETLPLLSIGVAASFGSTYKAARETVRSDPRTTTLSGVDGYVIPDPGMDGEGKRVTGARVVMFEPDRMVVVRVFVPGNGVDAVKATPATAADVVRHLSQPLA